MLADLRLLAPFAPLHQPHNLAGVDAARAAFPHVPQVACFDTAFHRGHSFVHDAYALPRKYYDLGLAAFWISRPFLRIYRARMREIDPVPACGRMIVAHLGNGASLCAMRRRPFRRLDHGIFRSRRSSDGHALWPDRPGPASLSSQPRENVGRRPDASALRTVWPQGALHRVAGHARRLRPRSRVKRAKPSPITLPESAWRSAR